MFGQVGFELGKGENGSFLYWRKGIGKPDLPAIATLRR